MTLAEYLDPNTTWDQVLYSSALKGDTNAAVADGTISQTQAAQNYAVADNPNLLVDPQTFTDVSTFMQQAADPGSSNGGPGLSPLLKDLLILAAIGGAVWLFVSFGGFTWLQGFTKKFKWAWYAIVGVVVLVGYVLYSTFKKTGKDTTNFLDNFSLNPFKAITG